MSLLPHLSLLTYSQQLLKHRKCFGKFYRLQPGKCRRCQQSLLNRQMNNNRTTVQQTESNRQNPSDISQQTEANRQNPTDISQQTESNKQNPTDRIYQTESNRQNPIDRIHQTEANRQKPRKMIISGRH